MDHRSPGGRVRLAVGMEKRRRMEIRNGCGKPVSFSAVTEPPGLSDVKKESQRNEDCFHKHLSEAAPFVFLSETVEVSGSAVSFTVSDTDVLPMAVQWLEIQKDNTGSPDQ